MEGNVPTKMSKGWVRSHQLCHTYERRVFANRHAHLNMGGRMKPEVLWRRYGRKSWKKIQTFLMHATTEAFSRGYTKTQTKKSTPH